MKHLSSILKKHIEETPILRSASNVLILDEVNKIISTFFGPTTSQFVEAKYIKNNFIYVWCKNSIIASEIRLNETDILAKLSQKKFDTKIIGIKIFF